MIFELLKTKKSQNQIHNLYSRVVELVADIALLMRSGEIPAGGSSPSSGAFNNLPLVIVTSLPSSHWY